MLLSSACWDFWEVAIFRWNQKEVSIAPRESSTPRMKYGCDLKAGNWTKALWSGNLRRQQLWHGCLHYRWKESRGSFFPSLSVSIVHFTVNSFWQSLHLFEMQVIQDSIKLEFWKNYLLISSLFFAAQLRLNFRDADSSFHVRKFPVMDSF